MPTTVRRGAARPRCRGHAQAFLTLIMLGLYGLLVGVAAAPRRAPYTAAAFGLLLLLRFAFVWIGVYLGVTFHANP